MTWNVELAYTFFHLQHVRTGTACQCTTTTIIQTLLLRLNAVIVPNDFIRNIQDLKLLWRSPPRHLAHRRMPRIQALCMLSPKRNLETPFARLIAPPTCPAGRSALVAFALLASAIEASGSRPLVFGGFRSGSGPGCGDAFHKLTVAGVTLLGELCWFPIARMEQR
jgi:hypothetical protein